MPTLEAAMPASVVAVALPSAAALVLALMSALVTGTAPAAHTTSPAAPTASSALPSRMKLLLTAALAVLTVTCHAHGATASVALPVPTVLIGSLETGFAPGLDATSTTLLVGWSVSGATHHGNPALRCRMSCLMHLRDDEVCSDKQKQQASPHKSSERHPPIDAITSFVPSRF